MIPPDPFKEPGYEHYFHATPELSQRLNLLHHLVHYSTLLLVVTGPKGSGKTTLLNRLFTEAREPWRAAISDAHAEMSPEELLRDINQGLDLHTRTGSLSDYERVLVQHLESAERGGVVTLVALDEAHLLPARALDYITRLAQDERFHGLRLLLLGEPNLTGLLASTGTRALTHHLELVPLSEAQVDEYLRIRLDGQGPPLDRLVEPAQLSVLHQQSGGLPGALNELASELLIQPADVRPTEARRSQNTKPLAGRVRRRLHGLPGLSRPVVWAGVGLLASVFTATIVLTLAKDPGNTPVVTDLPLPAPVPRPTTPPETLQEPARERSDTLIAPTPEGVRVTPLDQLAHRLQVPTTSAPTGASQASSSAAVAPPRQPDRPVTGPVTGVDTSDTRTRQRVGEIKSAASRPAVPAGTPEVIETPRVVEAPLSAEEWLASQEPDAYTLQLLATHERSAAREFIRKHKLDDARLLRTRFKGRDWYVVVQGSFASREKAVSHLPRLSPSIRRQEPWPRSFKSLTARR